MQQRHIQTKQLYNTMHLLKNNNRRVIITGSLFLNRTIRIFICEDKKIYIIVLGALLADLDEK